jgi:hypothetical protein
MKNQTCVWSAAGIAILAVGGLVFLSGQGNAAQDPGLKDGVLKIAAAVKKGDTSGADKQAAALAKKVEDLGDLMELFKPRDKGGIGVGPKAGVAVPDGIEKKLIAMERDAPSGSTLKKEADALEEMGYVIAAMAKTTKAKPVAKVKAKEWNGWCDDLAAAGVKLSAAAKSQTAAELKAVARKINASCNACHSTYRK